MVRPPSLLLLEELVPEEEEGDAHARAHEEAEHGRQAVTVLDLERQVLEKKRKRGGLANQVFRIIYVI